MPATTGQLAPTTPRRRRTALALLAVWAGIELVAFLYSILVNGYRCDESCNDNLVSAVWESGWSHWSGSWQWTWLWILSGLALAATIVAFAAVAASRTVLAARSLVACGCFVVAWLVLIATS